MDFIVGTRLYGKCDHVPRLFYVATTFAHVWFIPLIPISSYLFLPNGKQKDGVAISIHLKSILLAWLRAACFIATPILWIAALCEGASHIAHMRPPASVALEAGLWLGGAGLLALAILSYFGPRISRARALRVAEKARIDPAAVHAHFDRLEGKTPTSRTTDDQIDGELQRWTPNTNSEKIHE